MTSRASVEEIWWSFSSPQLPQREKHRRQFRRTRPIYSPREISSFRGAPILSCDSRWEGWPPAWVRAPKRVLRSLLSNRRLSSVSLINIYAVSPNTSSHSRRGTTANRGRSPSPVLNYTAIFAAPRTRRWHRPRRHNSWQRRPLGESNLSISPFLSLLLRRFPPCSLIRCSLN